MSLSIILASVHGIIIAADRRAGVSVHLNRVDPVKCGITPSGWFYFDGVKKAMFFEQDAHRYVGFSYTGDGSLDSEKLIKTLEHNLPAERLTIEEYAEALISIFFHSPESFKYPHTDFLPEDQNNIYVAGYNEDSQNAYAYHVNLPHNNKPSILINGLSGVSMSGVGDYVSEAQSKYIKRLSEKIGQQINNIQKLGHKIPRSKIGLYRFLKTGRMPLREMTLDEMTDFAELTINYTSEQQSARNEVPSVGGGVDIFSLTRDKGVQVISYEKHPAYADRPLAKTNYHHLIMSCCNQETKMQIDFAPGNTLVNSHVRFPSNKIFVCPQCKTEHDISEVKILAETYTQTEVVVE
jgi:hypothetical protein